MTTLETNGTPQLPYPSGRLDWRAKGLLTLTPMHRLAKVTMHRSPAMVGLRMGANMLNTWSNTWMKPFGSFMGVKSPATGGVAQ